VVLRGGMGMRVLGFADKAAGRRELLSYLERRILEEGKRSVGVSRGFEGGSANDLKRGWYWGRQKSG